MKYSTCAAWLLAGLLAAGPLAVVRAAPQPAAAAEETAQEPSSGGAPQKAPVRIASIHDAPLTEEDFRLGGLRLGMSAEEAAATEGMPQKTEHGSVYDESQWDGITVRFVQENAYAYAARDDLDIPDRFPSAGASVISAEKNGIASSRGITVGDSRENVVRSYGRPSQIYWDGPAQKCYFVYQSGGQQLVFTISKDHVQSMQLAFAGAWLPAVEPEILPAGRRFSDEEFMIAGYAVGQVFREHSWLVWEKKAVNPEEEIWYYPGFGVRMDAKSHVISSLFVTDGAMTTRRGVSVGDQLSTLEFLYGEPQKLEMNLAAPHPQSAYIYFSEDRKTALVFYINETEKVIYNIVSMKNPQIPAPLQPALDRIRSVRAKNLEGTL